MESYAEFYSFLIIEFFDTLDLSFATVYTKTRCYQNKAYHEIIVSCHNYQSKRERFLYITK